MEAKTMTMCSEQVNIGLPLLPSSGPDVRLRHVDKHNKYFAPFPGAEDMGERKLGCCGRVRVCGAPSGSELWSWHRCEPTARDGGRQDRFRRFEIPLMKSGSSLVSS